MVGLSLNEIGVLYEDWEVMGEIRRNIFLKGEKMKGKIIYNFKI